MTDMDETKALPPGYVAQYYNTGWVHGASAERPPGAPTVPDDGPQRVAYDRGWVDGCAARKAAMAAEAERLGLTQRSEGPRCGRREGEHG
jgi:hypothetical protein